VSVPTEEQFKAAMRHFPTGVTVVTSFRDDQARGVTVSSFCSVSLDPPMILICINREARSYLYISDSRVFCVNVLAGDQRTLAQRFAQKLGDDQFAGVDYKRGANGAAILQGAVAHLECSVVGEHVAGTHSIFIGRVTACASHVGSALGYYDGTFHDFSV